VSEVAPVGGFVKQYQVDLDPNALVAYNIPLSEVVNAIKMSNADVGGRVFEVATTEYFIRGRGYIKNVGDIENIVLKVNNGTPVYLKNIASVHLGGDIRRGVAELDGKGETVGGIVVMRYGENALNVIDGIKKKIEEIKSSLPEGVRIVPTYDRSDLIKRAIATLREKLIEESIVVALVCVVFLWHVRSSLVAIITLPIAIILSFIAMWWMNVTSNIMSLGGIAIAIGAMVDSAIIMIENAHKALEHFRDEHGREPSGLERANEKRRASAVLRSARHHGEFHPGVFAHRAGRPAVPAARVYENVFNVLRLVSRRDARAGSHVAFDSRQNHTGERQSGEPVFDFGISAVRQFRPALSLVHARVRGAFASHHHFPVQKTRERIHAATQ
jgi:Cu/Ag efflux pump CusA